VKPHSIRIETAERPNLKTAWIASRSPVEWADYEIDGGRAMQIILQSTNHAKSLAKSLRDAMSNMGVALKLGKAQEAVARMLGYADHRSLSASAGKGTPSPYEEEISIESAAERRDILAGRLAQALGVTPADGMKLVEAIRPLRRTWDGHEDWRARRQAYFAKEPLAGLPNKTDFHLWPATFTASSLPALRIDHALGLLDVTGFGPHVFKVDIAFGTHLDRETFRPEPVKNVWDVEYVYAKIGRGDLVYGWLKGVVANFSDLKQPVDLNGVAGLLDGPHADGATELFRRRLYREIIDDGHPFEKVFIVTDIVRDKGMTIPGAGAELFKHVAEAVVERHPGRFTVVINGTPPQYQSLKETPDAVLRSTGRAAAAARLRDALLRMPMPESMRDDVEVYDMGAPWRCAFKIEGSRGPCTASAPDTPEYVCDERDMVRAHDREAARRLFGGDVDPLAREKLVDEETGPEGFDYEETQLFFPIIQPHPRLWEYMPKAVVRIEVERKPEEDRLAWLWNELTEPDAIFTYRKAPPVAGTTDFLTFVFDNGTQIRIPDWQFGNGALNDVVGPGFCDTEGFPLKVNPYTDEMTIGDLWLTLTANAVLLYHGGSPLKWRNGRCVIRRDDKLEWPVTPVVFAAQDVSAMTRLSERTTEEVLENTMTKAFDRDVIEAIRREKIGDE
jgi:hypothetical protein